MPKTKKQKSLDKQTFEADIQLWLHTICNAESARTVLRAASELLALHGLIHNTPAAKLEWLKRQSV
jgi:hypothetical protein